jgi:hypothetical protein
MTGQVSSIEHTEYENGHGMALTKKKGNAFAMRFGVRA